MANWHKTPVSWSKTLCREVTSWNLQFGKWKDLNARKYVATNVYFLSWMFIFLPIKNRCFIGGVLYWKWIPFQTSHTMNVLMVYFFLRFRKQTEFSSELSRRFFFPWSYSIQIERKWKSVSMSINRKFWWDLQR